MDEAAKKTMERKQREGQKLAALAEQAKSRAERKRRWDLIKSKPQLSYDSGKLPICNSWSLIS